MSFTFKMIFTGICAYVPIVPASKAQSCGCEGVTPGDATRMVVVLIDADKDTVKEGVTALDGTRLKRHKAFLRVKLKNLQQWIDLPSMAKGKESELVWYFNRERLTIDTDSQTPFCFNWDPKDNHRMEYVPEMSVVEPGGGGIEEAYLGDCPPDGRTALAAVSGQVLVDCGMIHCYKRDTSQKWRIPQTLKDHPAEPYERTAFATRVVAEMEADRVCLNLASFNGGRCTKLALAPTDGEVEVYVSNLCDENPLEWESGREGDRDEDVKWLYELCCNKNAIQYKLQTTGRYLPFPRVVQADSGANPNKCMGFQFAPVVEGNG